MRAVLGLSVYLGLSVALLGCASPKPAATTTVRTATTETEQQRAQRLINHSIETGEPINTAERLKLICKQESVTNTRLKNRKLCMTAEQWAERSNNAKEAMRDTLKAGEYLPPEEGRR